MEPTEAKNTANEKLTHNKENTGKEAGTAPKEKIVLESGKNSSVRRSSVWAKYQNAWT